MTKDSKQVERSDKSQIQNLRKMAYIISRENKLGTNIIERKNRRLIKQQTRDFIIQSFAILTLTIVLSLQFYVGAWRNFILAPYLGASFGLSFIIVFLSLIIYPKFNLNVINKGFMRTGHFIFKIINSLLLGTFYLLTLPFALTIGRSRLLRYRPELEPWVKSAQAPDSTWRSGEYLNSVEGGKNFIQALFFTFMRERNIFLLIMLTLILIISMVLLFAQSSAVAPFIYTIF